MRGCKYSKTRDFNKRILRLAKRNSAFLPNLANIPSKPR